MRRIDASSRRSISSLVGARAPWETRSPGGEGIGPVEHQQMQVDVQVERRAKALDERDDAGLGTDTSAKPRTTLHRRGQRSRHHSEHAGEQVRARREEQAQRPRERQGDYKDRFTGAGASPTIEHELEAFPRACLESGDASVRAGRLSSEYADMAGSLAGVARGCRNG